MWYLAVFLGALSFLLILGNPLAGIIEKRRGRTYSFVPLVGGIAGCLACLLYPTGAFRHLAWIPLVLDISFPGLVYAIFAGAFRSRGPGDRSSR